MNLASVNTRLDFSIESLISKDVSLRALDNGVCFFNFQLKKKKKFLPFPELGFVGFLVISDISIK